MNSITEKKTRFATLIRFTGGGALIMALIGLILLSPLSASGRDGQYGYGAGKGDGLHSGQHYIGADPEGHVEFLEIVLDLSEKQTKEVREILAEQHEKRMNFDDGRRMAGRSGRGAYGRHEARRNHVHRHSDCDRVDRTEMRARMRRERREFENDREKTRSLIERHRGETEEKLAKVLDDDQMNKLRELHELREDHRDQRQERRERRGR